MSIISVALNKTLYRGRAAKEAAMAAKAPTTENVRNWLVQRLAEVLKVEPQEVDVNQSFADYGLGSMSAVRLAGDLETWLGREIPPTLTWDYPTIEHVVQYLCPQCDA